MSMQNDKLKKLLELKPINGTPNEMAAWRSEVQAARAQIEHQYKHWLQTKKDEWDPEEWQAKNEGALGGFVASRVT
jgi:hypothetical protein